MSDPTCSAKTDTLPTTTDLKVFVACVFPRPVLAPFIDQFDAGSNDTGRVLKTNELVARAQSMDALVITATNRIDAMLVSQLPSSVRMIATYSVGTDHIDTAALREQGIALFSTPDVLTQSCADAAILLMLGAARRVVEGSELIRQDKWTGWSPTQLLGQDMWGRRLGILGMGRIGQAVATRARGFGMTVHYHNRHQLAAEQEEGATYHASLDSLLESSDFLCVACPSGPSTRGMLDAEKLALLPSGAIVCNIGRGDIIDDSALVAALETGAIAAAGLDVFTGEPDIHPAYRTMPNVFGLPHIGSSTMATRVAMSRLLCTSLAAHHAGQPTTNRIC